MNLLSHLIVFVLFLMYYILLSYALQLQLPQPESSHLQEPDIRVGDHQCRAYMEGHGKAVKNIAVFDDCYAPKVRKKEEIDV